MTTGPDHRSTPATTVAEVLDAIDHRPPLAVEADLTVALAGTELTVVGYDDLVAVDAQSFGSVVALWRRHRSETTDAAAVLASLGVTVELQVRGVPVARLGAAATPSSVARLLGLGPVEILPEGALLAATRRSR